MNNALLQETPMNKTPLHAHHVKHGAKMGEFAGYDMPLYYGEGVMAEHEWVRAHAGLFDVSHMGQVTVDGAGATAFFERITPSAFAPLKFGTAKYTVLTNETGGIIDDLIVTRTGEESFFVVINAGCKDKDIAWMRKNLPAGVAFTPLTDRALIALQGPSAEKALHDALGIDASDLGYMRMTPARLKDGTEIFVSRLGYTGEDGFELSVPQNQAGAVWDGLLQNEAVKPIGLAARDSLRLEMGYPLYGHDIDDTTSPVEADLSWVIGKSNTGFIGATRVLTEKQSGAPRRRAGFKLVDKGVAREGSEIFDPAAPEKKIGILTSGGFSPSLKLSIGQGYIDPSFATEGRDVLIRVRGRDILARVEKMPFVAAKTKSAKSS